MDGMLPSVTSNGNTDVICSYFPNSVPDQMSRAYDPVSLETYIDHQTNYQHHHHQHQPMPSDSHHYQPYTMLHENVSLYDQTHHQPHTITNRLSQLNIDSTNSIQQQQKTNYNETNSVNAFNSSKTLSQILNRAETGSNQFTNNCSNNDNLNFFVSDFIKDELFKRLAKIQEQPSETIQRELPQKVDEYVNLIPIEPLAGATSFTFAGMVSTVYRGQSSKTGQLFCLRRFHSFQPNTSNPKHLMNTIDSWKKMDHANVIPLRQVFTSKAFGDNSVIFVYEYHPSAETLMSCYFANQLNTLHHHHTAHHSSSIMNGYSTSSRPYSQQQNTRKFLPEQTIWNYIIQISSALRTIHQSNLAFRSFDLTKILITSGFVGNSNSSSNNSFNGTRGRNARVRLSFCGVSDILLHDTFLHASPTNHRAMIQHFQQEDLAAFGRLCLALATNSLAAFNNHHQQTDLQEYFEMLPRTYSNDLRNLITYLISPIKQSNNATNKPRSIDDIMPMIGARFYMQLDHVYSRYDYLYDELAKEIDNGRLFRLLAKLGTINERPQHQRDPNWSETGDRYMLKLFRDYLFHQLDETGKPWLDLGHIISNLNKFDIGSQEKICLISRDGQNVLIVSFAELKRCFETAITELAQ